jgi:hypothetical protein
MADPIVGSQQDGRMVAMKSHRNIGGVWSSDREIR